MVKGVSTLPSARLLPTGFRGAWAQRAQLLSVFWRQYTAPYRQSLLGGVWAFILPVVPISAYLLLRAVIFPSGAQEGQVHSAVYVGLGALLWFYLIDLSLNPQAVLWKQKHFFAQGKLSGVGITLIAWVQGLLETGFRLPLVIAVVALFQTPVWAGIPYLALFLFCASIGAYGAGLILAIVSAFIPDAKILTGVVVRYLVFFSSVIFPIPRTGWLELVYLLNPLGVLINNARHVFIYGEVLDPLYMGGICGGCVIVFISGASLFQYMEPYLKEVHST